MQRSFLLLNAAILTVALFWFAAVNYRSAISLAGENLHGVALSLAAAVESAANHDPSLQSLSNLRPGDLAYLAVVDGEGKFRFHTNADLIGKQSRDRRHQEALRSGDPLEGRVALGTGERAYEYLSPLHLGKESLLLHLTLHTYRADAVIRQAKANLAILLALIATAWILSGIIYRMMAREERHQRELARRENLARLGEMGAMLAHEIRNPLAGIKGFAQIIVRKPAEARNSDFARRIVYETDRLENLVNDLLAYARSDTAVANPVAVDELVDHALGLALSGEHQVDLTRSVPPGLMVCGDRDRLVQVLLNLVHNAVQAMENRGTLKLAATQRRRKIIIAITDSGRGVPREELEKVFEPFFTTKAKGTGLGLSICRKIVEEHGGAMEIHSAPGEGTTVVVILPAECGAGRTEHK